jgi:hypothetical protein
MPNPWAIHKIPNGTLREGQQNVDLVKNYFHSN